MTFLIINYDYYDIEGRTAAELREQMDRNGVRWTNGNTYDAYTGWNVNWNYRYRVTGKHGSMLEPAFPSKKRIWVDKMKGII